MENSLPLNLPILRAKFFVFSIGGLIAGLLEKIEMNKMKLAHISSTIEHSVFETLQEISSDVIWTLTIQGGMTEYQWFASSENKLKFGLTDAKVHNDYRFKNIHPEDRERVIRDFQIAFKDNSTVSFELTYRIFGKDNTCFLINDKMKFLRNLDGRVNKIIGIWKELKNTEEQDSIIENLRRENQFLALKNKELSAMNKMQEELHRMAKIGCWEYNVENNSLFWDNEMYSIYKVDNSFNIDNLSAIGLLHDLESTVLITEKFSGIAQKKFSSFDINARLNPSLHEYKWVRIAAYPIFENEKLIRIIGVTQDFTPFKESEEHLKRSEEKFSIIFQNNPDLITIHRESDSVIIDVNKHSQRVFGYSREEVVGVCARDFNLFVNPDDRDRFYQDYFEDGFAEMETLWRKKDNTLILINITSSRVEINNEYYSLNIVKDVTAEKAAMEKFQKAFDLNPGVMIIMRARDRVILDASNKAEEIFGYKPGEVLGLSTSDFNIWANIEDRSVYYSLLNQHGCVSMEATLLKKSGEHFHAFITTEIIQLSGEIHYLLVVHDITEKKQEAEKLLLSEANLNATINNTNLFVCSVDSDMNLIMFNENFKKHATLIYGREPQIGQQVIPWDHPDPEVIKFKMLMIEKYKKALAGEVLEFIQIVRGKHIEFSLNPIYKHNKITGISVFVEDITERVKKEEELAEANIKIGELRLMALRSVMNPHFIFNALNSIQYYILHSDRINAINYLSTFSQLIRSILNNTVNDKIRLSEEIEQLNYYITLEQMRFEDRFEFVLNIEEDLNLKKIEIPSLLIQPFVENAILHGLCNIKEKGILTLSIRKEVDSILFEIEDNGIGREASMKLRDLNLPVHKSLGSSLTEERLKLINAQRDISFEIVDLMKDNKPSGTKVKIWVKNLIE